MRLTPNEFAKQLPNWYLIWRNHNSGYFPLEGRLTQKARTAGYLEMSDLVAITEVLGNPYNIGGRVQRANTNDEVMEKTKETIRHINNPASALQTMMSIKRWGRTYASKTLRCICPHKYAALDSKLIKGISLSYLRSKNEIRRYEEFLNLCEQIRQALSLPGPRKNGAWFIADVEIALFQFIWDGNEIV